LTVLFFALSSLYLAIQSQMVQRFLTNRLTSYSAEKLHINIHIGGVDVSLLNKILLDDVWVEDQSGDTLAFASQISARINHLSFIHKQINVGHLTLNQFKLFIKKDPAGIYNFQFLTRPAKKDSVPSKGWNLTCSNFRLKNSDFYYQDSSKTEIRYDVNDINFRINKFSYSPDSVSFHLASLTLVDSRGFFLTDLSADFQTKPGIIELSRINLQTLNSHIENARFALLLDTASTMVKRPEMEILLKKANISLADVAVFVPGLKGMDQKLEVSGKLSGNPANLKVKELVISTGKNTKINCDLDISAFEGMKEPFLYVDLYRSQTDFYDISHLKLPETAKLDYLKFPEKFYQAGVISYQGNFTGFLSDFVAYGTINSQMGQIKSDLSFVPVSDGSIRFNGKLETTEFQIGKLLNSEDFGEISLSGMVKGLYFREGEKIDADFNGIIEKFYAYRYNYSNIRLNGKIGNRKFDGKVVMDDPHLKMNFSGLLNLNEKVPQFDFILNLKKADLVALRLDTMHTVSDLALEMTANFTGSSLDNFDGLIQVFNAEYTNPNNTLLVKNLNVNTHLEEKNSSINLNSDFVDASIVGTYHFKSLFNSFRNVLASYLPALRNTPSSGNNFNQFNFELTCKNLEPLTAVFIPEWKIATPFTIRGKIDSNISTFELNGKIPGISTNQIEMKNINLDITPESSELNSRIKFDEVGFMKGLSLRNLDLNLKAGGDKIETNIAWNNHKKNEYSGNILSEISFSRDSDSHYPGIQINLQPSKIVISDTIWNLSPATLIIDSTDVSVEGFSFYNGNQELTLDGIISKDKTQQLNVNLRDINLGTITDYIKKPSSFKGLINGSIGISDFYARRVFLSDLRLTGFEYMNQSFGDISLVSQWDRNTETIKGDLSIIRDKRKTLSGTGSFNPKNNNLDFLVKLDQQSIELLGTVIRETFSNFHGDGTGMVRLTGTPDKLLLDGAVFCKNAGLTIDYTRVSYLLNDSVRFAGDKIIFRNIEISDITGNKGIFTGNIRHDSFGDMDFDLKFNSNKIIALNTTIKDNEGFYGKAIVRGNLNITGHDVDVKLSGEATSLPETSVTIVLDDDIELAKYDFIKFVQTGKETGYIPAPIKEPVSGGVEVDLIIHATPEAKVQMIYNTQITDIIRAQGEGTLRFNMDKAENISLYGNFTVEQGEYLFTLQDVIRKRFTVENGGSIAWSGDPYNAVIDLKAIYKLKASLYELMMGSLEDLSSKQRIPIECKIMLTGDLMRPDISLGIEFPAIEERLRDELQQFFSTQEDMNRQMLSLLVLGKFYTPDFVRGNYQSNNSGLIGNTASDLFSNQLSNWLSQINKDVNVGINYRPGNQLTNDEIELALSTQIFNDRVRINGNIGNNSNPNRASNSELVGDFEIEVKLSPNGKLQLKAYNKSNNNLIYETAPYTQGLGFAYKEDYNTFGELWKKFLGLFRK
jgi:hypothetical protein